MSRISGLVSFEPDIVSVQLDGTQLRLEPGQALIPHGPDRDLTVDEALPPVSGEERSPPKGGDMARLLSVNVGLPRDIEWKSRFANRLRG